MPTTTEPKWSIRLLWFVALWAAGVLAVGTVAYALRWLFKTI